MIPLSMNLIQTFYLPSTVTDHESLIINLLSLPSLPSVLLIRSYCQTPYFHELISSSYLIENSHTESLVDVVLVDLHDNLYV